MPETVLLKLGGAVLTRKDQEGMMREAVIDGISREIADHGPLPLLIVHGAGSCGHPEARKFGLSTGLSPGNLAGVEITHRAVSRLNARLVASLRSEGCEAVGIHPFHAAYAENGRLVAMETRHIRQMVDRAIVPVLHGDVVMDGVRGVSIVSGDQLVVFLARALGIRRIGLATDVDGVFDGERVIPEITPGLIGTIAIGASRHTDVTGGMEGKVQELLGLAQGGTSSAIFHADRIGDFLDGRPHGGTVVRGG
ncbi:MAG TPA: isopentenyl phosphate kinase [Methanoregulaceae archaeon]|nr:MAG: isopentenyl phosphate kinase family protein [Methanolinea sp.]HON81186.1 isopentenyl phosphate kinase [Methanoregulaceae archaeon]HPD09870.1 isopentenyl phosphate kinase [Methanoregulaceae archaeon]HRT14939.1 isopentenyl phosphate kinase [Methanoregulaceae archaeon]HRU30446.1 isopentenyl phosphate kinase [Methanoregulaceae archaeon]